MALPNFISGIFGVTEPAIYGILLPLKKPFVISCIAGCIGGGFYGAFNFRKFMMGGMGIFEFPAMIEPDGSMGNLIVAVAGVVITMIIAFAATMLIYKDDSKKNAEVRENTDQVAESVTKSSLVNASEIVSPMNGKVLKLEEIQDDAFASGVLGKGAAIVPEDGNVYAPADGEISALFPTLHAIGMKTDAGAELLIHIGLDTVQLEGEGFEAFVKQGDHVKQGQKLVSFDMDFIKGKGYCLETPVLITNMDDYLDILETDKEQIKTGEVLLNIVK